MRRVVVSVVLSVVSLCASATAGYGVGGKCYATGAEFAQAACLAYGIGATPAGNPANVYSCGSAAWVGPWAVLAVYRGAPQTSNSVTAGTITPLWAGVYPAACEVESDVTDADQVNATLAIFGLGLGLLAVLWGGRKVFEVLAHGRRET